MTAAQRTAVGGFVPKGVGLLPQPLNLFLFLPVAGGQLGNGAVERGDLPALLLNQILGVTTLGVEPDIFGGGVDRFEALGDRLQPCRRLDHALDQGPGAAVARLDPPCLVKSDRCNLVMSAAGQQ